MVMKTSDGENLVQQMKVGSLVYVPPYWAHRSVNTGSETLTMLAIWAADAGHKARGERLKVSEHSPENLLGQHGLALFARMGESVTTRRSRAANHRERTTMKSQRVTHVVETNRVRQLCVEHRNLMAPRRKCASGLVHPSLTRQLWHEIGRNEIAELPQNAELGCRWAGLFFHTLPSCRFKCPRPSNPQLFHLLCGMAVVPNPNQSV